MKEVLRNYDKLLTYKKNLDGSVDIIRKSPFDTQKEHNLFKISNQYIGSANWVLRKLISMDTTKYDLVGNAMRHNWAIRERRDSRNMHEDLAEFMVSGGSTFIN